MTVSPEIHWEIANLQSEHALLLDEDRLEEWLGLFTEDCLYRIAPRENIDQGLPASLYVAQGQEMLRDRVVYLRQVATYNVHRSRHMLGPLRIRPDGVDAWTVTQNFTVYQSEPERGSRLYAVGYYEDRIVRSPLGLRFQKKLAVIDGDRVMTLLAEPL